MPSIGPNVALGLKMIWILGEIKLKCIPSGVNVPTCGCVRLSEERWREREVTKVI